MARSKAQGRKGKQKNKPQGAGGKKNAGGNEAVAKNKQPNDKTSKRERQQMIRAEIEVGEMPQRKKMMTRSQGSPEKIPLSEKPKSIEDLDKEMDVYIMKDAKLASEKLDEDVDSLWEQKTVKEAEEAEKADEAF